MRLHTVHPHPPAPSAVVVLPPTPPEAAADPGSLPPAELPSAFEWLAPYDDAQHSLSAGCADDDLLEEPPYGEP